jgi:hypothetical protein
LQIEGISHSDAWSLRLISLTLHHWHERDCGDGNAHGSWCIVRGAKKATRGFMHDDDGTPWVEWHHYRHGNGADTVTYTPIPDREKGAHKRLGAILAKYPHLQSFIQTDPRGCALYILRKADVPQGEDVNCIYNSRGIAVF